MSVKVDISTLDQFKGLPFKDKGRNFDGIDCWGLCLLFYEKVFGILLPDFCYRTCKDLRIIERIFSFEKNNWKILTSPTFYCIVGFSTNQKYPKIVNHFVVYLGYNKFLNILNSSNAKSKEDSLNDPYWRPKLRGFYEYTD